MTVDAEGGGSRGPHLFEILQLVIPIVLFVGVPLLVLLAKSLFAALILIWWHRLEIAAAIAWIGVTAVLWRLTATMRVQSAIVCHGPFAVWFAFSLAHVVSTLGTLPLAALRNVGSLILHIAFTYGTLDIRRPNVWGVLLSILVNGVLFVSNILVDPPETSANLVVQLLFRVGLLVVSFSLFSRAGELYGTTPEVPR